MDSSIETYRHKRDSKQNEIRQSSDYKLLTPNHKMTPMGAVADMLMKAVLEAKRKNKGVT